MRPIFYTLALLCTVSAATGAYALPLPHLSLRPVVYQDTAAVQNAFRPPTDMRPAGAAVPEKQIVTHIATPPSVKALYMSQCYASTPRLREALLKIADTTEINSIMVDIKDYTGTIAFTPTTKSLVVGGAGCKVADMRELVADMHRRGIYVIGRITVFQDPFMVAHKKEWAVKRKSNKDAVWKDRKGLGFIDVGAREYWDYIVALSRDSHDVGFDELNFDYVRFPSDGNMADALYTHSTDSPRGGTKAEYVEMFFQYLTTELRKPYEGAYTHVVKNERPTVDGTPVPHTPVLSADIFGMTTTNTDDLTIGQVLERALAHFDYVAPMVYPSHYPKGFNGYKDPNKNVYGVIKFSMDKAVARAKATETEVEGLTHTPQMRDGKQVYIKQAHSPEKLRTWIQDFNYGGTYTAKEVRDQIQATYDAGLTSWMVWNASNRYTVSALKKE